ncbi:MAG: 2-C-methyl-D-erythritol 2,4-cyclodiphosphate synthase [Desulfobacterales bacterium]|nr:2-C-methyl-D-erythritol 2,4-cyclodiphosphate synthase [Desulfobacterales bacterium]
MRIGQGYDVHRLVAGRDLILGGVKIPHEKGLLGHSDADVLLHAVCDALLGAAGFGDIGHQFPDSDPQFKGISSLILLAHCMVLVGEKGFQVVNLDITLLAEKPKLAPYRQAICENIAEVLCIDPEEVGLKATTTEGLGPVGRGEGMAALCVVLLERGKEAS